MHEELNKKIAEWLGWEFHPDGVHWRMSSGVLGWSILKNLPDFPTSLDACFEYIVPKLNRISIYTDKRIGPKNPDTMTYGGYKATVEVSINNVTQWQEIGEGETPALALCLAVEKLIDATG